MTHLRYRKIFIGTLGVVAITNVVSLCVFILNPEMFYYRAWEYFDELAYEFDNYDARWDAIENSDLTRNNFFYYQEPHLTRVTTDADGFRSVPLQSDSYHILVSGDSTIFGSGLSDNETLPWMLSEILEAPVFNGARTSLGNLLKKDGLSEVRLIIDLRTERAVKGGVFNDYGLVGDLPYTPLLTNNWTIFDLPSIVPAQRYLVTSVIPRIVKRMGNDLELWLNGYPDEQRYMYHEMDADDLDHAVTAIKQRNDMITSSGIRYVFVVVPAKQTIYSSAPDTYTLGYVEMLTRRLRELDVETINLVDEFRVHAQLDLYRDFDTHWNGQGVRVAAEKIANHLNATGY